MDEAQMAEQRGRARRMATSVALLVGAALAMFMFVPTGSNGYVAVEPDGTHSPRTYFFSIGTLLLREVFGGENNLHHLGITSAIVGTVMIVSICSLVYRLVRDRQQPPR